MFFVTDSDSSASNAIIFPDNKFIKVLFPVLDNPVKRILIENNELFFSNPLKIYSGVYLQN